MAITRLDAAASIAASATLTYAVAAGSDRCLIVATGYEDGSAGRTVTGVDYGGQAMEQIAQDNTVDSGTATGTSLWFLNDAGIVANSGDVITVTYDTAPSVDEMIHAASYENVEQAGGATSFPQTATYEQNEELPNPNTTVDLVETDGGLLIGSNSNGNANAYSWTGLTEQTDQADSSAQSSFADRLSTTSANVDIEATISGTANRHAGCSAEIAEVSAGAGPITISQDSAIVNGEGTQLVSSALTPVSGDTQLFIQVSVDDITEGDITTITSSPSQTITQLADFTNGNRRCRLYAIANPQTSSTTVTVNFGSATDASINVFTVKGSDDAADPSDVAATSNGNSASPSTSITPNETTKGMIIWQTCASIDGTYSSLGTGQTSRGSYTVGGAEKNSALITTEIYTAAPGSQSATRSKSGNWIGLATEIKEASAAGEAFERTASQTLTHSSVEIREGSTFNRAVADAQVHSSSVLRQGSTFNRAVVDAQTHIDSVVRVGEHPRIVAQALTHVDAVARAESTFNRTATQNLIHSSVENRQGSVFNRVAATILTHIDAIVTTLTLNRAAAQALTHSEAIVTLQEHNRTVAQNLTHSSIENRLGSTFNRIASTVLTHIDAVASVVILTRTAAQILTHIDSVVRAGSTFNRTASTALVHSSVVNRLGSTFNRLATTILTHIDAVASTLTLNRTASQNLIHSEVISRAGSTFNRTATTILTHIDSALRQGSTFARTVVDALVHSSSVVVVVTSGAFERVVSQILTHLDIAQSDGPPAIPEITKRPKRTAIKPLQELAPEITFDRTTVILQISLWKQELVSTRITNKLQLTLHQRESITTRLIKPDQWLVKDHTKLQLNLTLRQKERLFSTFNLKLTSNIHRRLTLLKAQYEHQIAKLTESNEDLTKRYELLKTSLEAIAKNTMSAEDVLALFSTTD